ncbi:MAG: hypothetical protein NTU88_11450 [Armatimonadetes bacterium]|nr:hypothetical protein [Armatimonadota bacterium]
MDEQNEQNQQPAEPTPAPEPEAAQPAPQPTPAPPPPGPPQNTNALITWGFVMAGLGLVCCCCGPLFSIAAIVLGIIAYSRGDQRGMWVIITGAVTFFLGGGIGFTYLRRPQIWQPYFQHQFPGPWRST